MFVFSAKQGDCHDSERICLMPLEDDTEERPEGPNSPSPLS